MKNVLIFIISLYFLTFTASCQVNDRTKSKKHLAIKNNISCCVDSIKKGDEMEKIFPAKLLMDDEELTSLIKNEIKKLKPSYLKDIHGHKLFYEIYVDSLGNITNVKSIMDYPHEKDLDSIIQKVIKENGKWEPAYTMFNGKKEVSNWVSGIIINLDYYK